MATDATAGLVLPKKSRDSHSLSCKLYRRHTRESFFIAIYGVILKIPNVHQRYRSHRHLYSVFAATNCREIRGVEHLQHHQLLRAFLIHRRAVLLSMALRLCEPSLTADIEFLFWTLYDISFGTGFCFSATSLFVFAREGSIARHIELLLRVGSSFESHCAFYWRSGAAKETRPPGTMFG
jgi:hypothetical protein